MHISTFEFIIKIILNDKNLTMLTFFFHLKIKSCNNTFSLTYI